MCRVDIRPGCSLDGFAKGKGCQCELSVFVLFHLFALLPSLKVVLLLSDPRHCFISLSLLQSCSKINFRAGATLCVVQLF